MATTVPRKGAGDPKVLIFHRQVGQKSSCMKSLALMGDLEIPADCDSVTADSQGNNLADHGRSAIAASG